MVKLVVVILFLASGLHANAADSEGERLAYVLGCINCHHQTPKEIINAPPLLIVQAYTLEQLTTLLRTGITSTGRNLPEIGSIMGIVAIEQFSYLKDNEILFLYNYLKEDWSHEKAVKEEEKIPKLYRFESDVVE